MNTITTITLTYNEEDDIERCLNSLQWADERILMDSYSTDSTVKKAKLLCTKVLKCKMSDFSFVRNRAIEAASSEWILMVDADEVIPQELSAEIREAIESDNFDGYYINRINYMYGIKLDFDQPDYHLILFKREKSQYKDPVHETAQVNGKTTRLDNSFIHYSMNNLTEHMDKMNIYTDLSLSDNRDSGLRLFVRPFYRLYQYLLLKRSYRYGPIGIISALNAFFYEFVVLFKFWERRYIKRQWSGFYESIDIESEIKSQEHVHKEFVSTITDLSPKALLEVGTGAGAISFSMARDKNALIVVLDNDIRILKNIKANAKRLGLNVLPVCADAFNLPFKDNVFVVSFSQGLMEHFEDRDIGIILKEKIRVSSDSAFFSVPNNYYKHKDFGNERLLSRGEWEKRLTGFSLLESKNYYFTRTKKNFLVNRPIMYMARLGK